MAGQLTTDADGAGMAGPIMILEDLLTDFLFPLSHSVSFPGNKSTDGRSSNNEEEEKTGRGGHQGKATAWLGQLYRRQEAGGVIYMQ